MNIQDWFPPGWTGWISLQAKGLWRVFSNTTVQKHRFFGAQIYWPTVQQAEWAWIQFSGSVISNSLRLHGLQHARLRCPSPSSRACSNLHPLSQWRHPTISSLFISFSSCLQSFPVSGSFPMSQLFTSDGHSIGTSASASVFPMNIQDWFPLGLVWYPCSPRGS